jgi:hypothetical protein
MINLIKDNSESARNQISESASSWNKKRRGETVHIDDSVPKCKEMIEMIRSTIEAAEKEDGFSCFVQLFLLYYLTISLSFYNSSTYLDLVYS